MLKNFSWIIPLGPKALLVISGRTLLVDAISCLGGNSLSWRERNPSVVVESMMQCNDNALDVKQDLLLT